MSEGGCGCGAGWTGVRGRGQDGVGGPGLEDVAGGVVVVVVGCGCASGEIGCYEGMASRKFCPELVGCLGKGIILARE